MKKRQGRRVRIVSEELGGAPPENMIIKVKWRKQSSLIYKTRDFMQLNMHLFATED